MRLQNLHLQNFKGFKDCEIDLDKKSSVIFGVNGAGKSSILASITYLCWNWLNKLNPSQGTAFKSLNSDLVHSQASHMEISGEFDLNERTFLLQRSYTKAGAGKAAIAKINKRVYDEFVLEYVSEIGKNNMSLPIFANYGTNRAVLDIPSRIKNKHEFSQLSSLERASENALDFRAFFEWFQEQQAYELEMKDEHESFAYKDKSLECVRNAVQSMLPEFTNLKVKFHPKRMTVEKNGEELRVDQLSDGEKCTLSLFGDLGHRLALANPLAEDPLKGSGIVLIDEIELHMHPRWQRTILPTLRKTFPNIQFIVTTHSPQVLGEVDDNYKLFILAEDEERNTTCELIEQRMDGFSSDYLLDCYMNSNSVNPAFQNKVDEAYLLINTEQFNEAKQAISDIKHIVGESHGTIIALEGALRRREFLYEKNHQK